MSSRRVGASGLLAAACLAAALACLLVAFRGSLAQTDTEAAANGSRTFLKRALAGAYASEISPDFLLEARDLIPRDGTFAVETGSKTPVQTPITLDALPAYAQFVLLPRRRVAPAKAEWLLCYGCDLATSGPRIDVVWSSGPGIEIARVRP